MPLLSSSGSWAVQAISHVACPGPQTSDPPQLWVSTRLPLDTVSFNCYIYFFAVPPSTTPLNTASAKTTGAPQQLLLPSSPSASHTRLHRLARSPLHSSPLLLSLLMGKQENILSAYVLEGTTGRRERQPVYLRDGRTVHPYTGTIHAPEWKKAFSTSTVWLCSIFWQSCGNSPAMLHHWGLA